MRALVVDDDSMNRELLRRMLVRLGWSVDDASDGRAAQASCEHASYDLVLVDLMMPGIDGMATAGAIRAATKEAASGGPCLIAASGSERRDDHDAVFDGFLGKPFILSELASCIEAALKCRRQPGLPPSRGDGPATGSAI
ncbi:MAG: hypothetical protein CVV51_08480 [Spirochaetae bacterium HGW-Spirochaetae-7]|nr:MAG: hypothetical protein CVV51_08480 [Spirochaetae bacterium HGW-Spirochaetae-7]